MSKTLIGLLVGLLLGTVWAFGGFGDFILVIVIGAIGLVVGLVLDGKLDVGDYLSASKK